MAPYKKYEVKYNVLISEMGFTIKTETFYLGDCWQNVSYPNLYISPVSFIYKYNKTHYIVSLYNSETDMTYRVEATDWMTFASEIVEKINLYFAKS